MRVSIIQPYLPVLDTSNPTELSGAIIALDLILRRYANEPSIESLELFLNPRDMVQADNLRALAAAILKPENRGKGKLEFHSIYAIPDIWKDGKERVIHTDDLHLLARDRDLRDRFAHAPTVVACDVHCMGHRGLVESLRQLTSMPRTEFDVIYAVGSAVERSIRATLAWFGRPDVIDVECEPRLINDDGLFPADPETVRRALRKAFDLPEDGVIGLVFGRMTPATKGDLLVLTEVFAQSSGPGEHLAIVGVEELRGYADLIKEMAARHGASERVHVRGPASGSAKGDLYRACDFVVFPADSGNEVFGLVTVEAMACGLPVIGSDWDGLKDTIEHGVTGYKISTYEPPNLGRFDELSWLADEQTTLLLRAQATVLDRRAISTALKTLFGDHARRAKMGSAARKRFEEHLFPDTLFAKRLAAFGRQLERARSEAADWREERLAAARRPPLQIPLREQFAGYGTADLFEGDPIFQITEKGQRTLGGYLKLELYAELLTLLPQQVVELALRSTETPRRASELIAIAQQTNVPGDLLSLAVAVLCKNGHVSVARL